MKLRLYNIIAPLQPYIKIICSMESENNSCNNSSFRVLPDTCVELFVNYAGSGQTVTAAAVLKQPTCFIVSRMSRYMDVQNQERAGFISVCFHPGAAAHFFPVAMHEVSDMVIGLTDLWKGLATEMEERVVGAGNNHERVIILQQYLLQQLEKHQL